MNLKFNPFYAVFSKGRPNTPQDVDLVVVQQAIPPHHLSTSTEVAFNQMFLAASTAPDTLVGCGFAHISLVWIWLIKFLFNLEGSATPYKGVYQQMFRFCFGVFMTSRLFFWLPLLYLGHCAFEQGLVFFCFASAAILFRADGCRVACFRCVLADFLRVQWLFSKLKNQRLYSFSTTLKLQQ